jgi:hypothetical protein
MTTPENPKESVVFADTYTGEERYGLVERNYGGNAIIRIVSKEESGPNPTRIIPRPNPRIAAITGGTGVIDDWIREP